MKRWEAAKSLLAVGEIRLTLEQVYKFNERKRTLFWVLLMLTFIFTSSFAVSCITYGISIVHKELIHGLLLIFTAIPILVVGATCIIWIKTRIGALTERCVQLYGLILQKKYLREYTK